MSNGLASVEPGGPLFRLGRHRIGGCGLIEGDDEPPSAVPRTWLGGRLIGEATVEGPFVDVGDTASLAKLRMVLAAHAIHYGLDEIDAATIRLRAPRAFTQQVSRYVHEQGVYAGLRYRSRLGDDVVSWAIFEAAPEARSPSSRRPRLRLKGTMPTCAALDLPGLNIA
jgi:hypothetical protein